MRQVFFSLIICVAFVFLLRCGDVDICALIVVIFVQGSWDGYAPSDQRLGNVKKFLSVVADLGLPGFSVKDLDEVRVPLSVATHTKVGMHARILNCHTFEGHFLLHGCCF